MAPPHPPVVWHYQIEVLCLHQLADRQGTWESEITDIPCRQTSTVVVFNLNKKHIAVLVNLLRKLKVDSSRC